MNARQVIEGVRESLPRTTDGAYRRVSRETATQELGLEPDTINDNAADVVIKTYPDGSTGFYEVLNDDHL